MTSNDVDLRDLAVDRGNRDRQALRARRNIFSRYILPGALIAGFLALVAWAARDILLPPRFVTVVPVLSTTAKAQLGGTTLFQAAGWVEPRPTPLRVAALAPGVVQTLLVVEDQEIKQGDPVAELIRDDAKLAHDAAVANLQLRHAELEEHEATLSAAETRLKQPVHLEATLNQAEAALASLDTELKNLPFQLRRAKADYTALQSDYTGKESASGIIAGTKIDIALGKSDAAKAMVEELRDRFDSLSSERSALASRCTALKTQLELLSNETQARDEEKAHIKAAKARIKQAEVAVAEAKLRLDRMTIVAPADGRVFRLIAHPGARIGSGMTQMEGHDGSTVITMYRPKMLQVRVDTRFEDIPKVSLGQTVEIGNPALTSPLLGTVLFISSEADIQKNTLQVKVAIPDPPEVFKPEMLVDVTFLAPDLPNMNEDIASTVRRYLPQQVIQTDDVGSYVWIADQSEGIAKKSRITCGPVAVNGLVEIFEGINVSSRVISSSVDDLLNGTRVRVTGEDKVIGTDIEPLSESTTTTTNRNSDGGN
ncbi:MAG: efflux RND transporter periplasmic adaptor subunit [Rubripirellula sp.]|nr:hemolysin D [Rhodopirellula sp.]MCH1441966.1 efflux RND transporter periplasmic adaptor subunit [Rubripirellula sp.]